MVNCIMRVIISFKGCCYGFLKLLYNIRRINKISSIIDIKKIFMKLMGDMDVRFYALNKF